MSEVFVSYARGDVSVADRIRHALEQRHVSCVVAPRGGAIGNNATEQAAASMAGCKAFILVYSKATEESEEVRHELAAAFNLHVRIYPFRVDSIQGNSSIEFFLSNAPLIDATVPPLDPHIQNLADAILATLKTKPASSAGTERETEWAERPPPHAWTGADLPERIDQYRILRVLSRGMGVVLLAEENDPPRQVVLKLPMGGRLVTERARQRFEQEIRIHAGNEHRGVVPIYRVGQWNSLPYYTMKFVDGENLADYLSSGPRPLKDRLRIFQELCEVVASLHVKQLVHRDLKPENVMVDRAGHIWLLDFGLARALEDDRGTSPATTTTVAGTWQYMAPEQSVPQQPVTTAADVYSLGMILYQILTGEFPYLASGSTRDQIVQAIWTSVPEPPSRRKPEIGTEFDGVVLRCLEKNPGARYQSAGELQRALPSVPGDGQGSDRVAKPGSIDTGNEPEEPTDSGQDSMRKVAVGMLAAGAILLLLGFGFMAGSKGRSDSIATENKATNSTPPSAAISQPAAASALVAPAIPAPASTPPETPVHPSPAPATPAVTDRIELEPEPEPAPPPLRAPPREISGLPVPTSLWGEVTEARTELRQHANRRHGVILTQTPPVGKAEPWLLRWGPAAEDSRQEQVVRPGEHAVLMVPANQKILLQWIQGELIFEGLVTAPVQDVIFVDLLGGR